MTTSDWLSTNLPDQTGRTFVITGASSGIGAVAARDLAAAGAHVILAVRNVGKGQKVADGIEGSTEVRELDLTSLASVRAFADTFTGADTIDVLINNAGVMATPEQRTADGFELQIGTNHLGHFALTNLLLPRISQRVVNVASGAHRMGRIRLDDLNWNEPGAYSSWAAYGQSKLANLLFTSELQRRLAASGSSVIATAAHPGYAATHLQGNTGSRLQTALMAVGNRFFAQDDNAGALPTIYAATADIPGDSYVGPDGFMEMRGRPELVDRKATARDTDVAARLWTLSEELTGVTSPLGLATGAAA